MNFIPTPKDELKTKISDGGFYMIEYLDKDYFNGDEILKKENAKAIINGDDVMFIIIDDYGMEKFISKVRLV